MILSKDEAICLVLNLSRNNEVSSPTKLNKLLARLNLHFIPIDIDFSLNKWGSFNAELSELEGDVLYEKDPYQWEGRTVEKFVLKPEGKKLFAKIKTKLDKIMTTDDFERLREDIAYLSTQSASQISGDEHKKLLVDIEDKFKLVQRANFNTVELLDLYSESKEIPEDSIATVRLKALIEYCYYLSKFLKEIRFKRTMDEYDFDAYMFDYYFLYNIEIIIPFLKEQTAAKEKDAIHINQYYQFIINSVKGRYPFSLDNPDLKKLIIV